MKRFEYKKVIGFTKQQKKAFEVLEDHGIVTGKQVYTTGNSRKNKVRLAQN